MQFLVEEALAEHLELVQAHAELDALAEHLELVQAHAELDALDDAVGGEVERSLGRRDRLLAAGGA